jgi:DNA-binding CsgD family transcriptional regulator
MKEQILELRRKGLTINKIVEIVGCAKSTVSYHINNNGLGGQRDNFLNGIDDSIIIEIQKLRLEDKTYSEILKIINISEDKLIKICRNLSLNFSVGGFKKKEINEKEVLNYYLKINSLRKTALYFNVSRGTIKNCIPSEHLNIKREKKISKSQAVVDYRKRVKLKLVEYKGGCCEKCGYNKSEQALQFHHINPEKKDFTVGGKSYSFERMKLEVDKCIMVCANCHIEIHEELRKNNE